MGIMQQIVPFHQSTVDIHFSANLVVMTTENVARLCLKEPSVSPVSWHQRSVEIDGTVFSAVKTQGKLSELHVWFFVLQSFTWYKIPLASNGKLWHAMHWDIQNKVKSSLTG